MNIRVLRASPQTRRRAPSHWRCDAIDRCRRRHRHRRHRMRRNQQTNHSAHCQSQSVQWTKCDRRRRQRCQQQDEQLWRAATSGRHPRAEAGAEKTEECRQSRRVARRQQRACEDFRWRECATDRGVARRPRRQRQKASPRWRRHETSNWGQVPIASQPHCCDPATNATPPARCECAVGAPERCCRWRQSPTASQMQRLPVLLWMTR
jgi:hypothetical protein